MRFHFSTLHQFGLVTLALTLLVGSACWAGELELSPAEQAWLDAHPVIRMSVEAGYGPYTFLDTEGQVQGVAVDFFADIERFLGIRFEIVSNLSWLQQMQTLRERRLDAVATVVKLPERETFIEFTEIYLPTPLVITTRSETSGLHSLKELQQLSLTLVKGYSSSKQLIAEFPDLRPHYVTTPLEGLRSVASGATDAYVGVLGVNSFLATQHGILNLKTNGAFDMVDNGQRFGVRKDWPQLARLLDKALLAISVERRNAIFQRWLPQHAGEIERLSRPGYVARLFPWLLGSLGLALLSYFVVLLWNSQLKKELAQRRFDLERAQSIAHLGNWSMEVKSERVHWSDELFRIVDLAPRSVVPDWPVFREWVHPDEREQYDHYFQRIIRSRPGDSQSPLIVHLLRPNGDALWLEITSAVEFDSTNSLIRIYGTAQDITEHKQAKEELQENQRKMETLMGNLPGMAYRCINDTYWTMEFVSEGVYSLTGYRSKELIDNTKVAYTELIHPEDRQMVWDTIQEELKDKQLFELSYRIITAGGEEKWVWEKGKAILGTKNEVIALEGFINDITEQKKAEEELENHREYLHDMVKERTAELKEKVAELERMNTLFVGREFRIKELKDKVKELELKLEN